MVQGIQNLRQFRIKYKWVLVLLVVSILSFYFNGWYWFLGVFIALLLLFANLQQNRKSDNSVMLLIAVFFFHIIIATIRGSQLVVFRSVIMNYVPAIVMYIIGNKVAYMFDDKTEKENIIFYMFLLFAISIGMQHIIITVQDIFVVGLVNPERYIHVLGEELDQMPTTQRNIDLSLLISFIGLVFWKPDNRVAKKIKLYAVIFSVIAILCSIHYVSRSGLVLVALSLAIGLWGGKKISWSSFIIIIIGVFFLSLISDTTLFQVFAERNDADNNFSNAGNRTELWEWGLQEILQNPFGVNKRLHYAHNTWIDLGVLSGIIPFLLLIWFSLKNIGDLIKIARERKYGLFFRFFLLMIGSCVYASLMTEPCLIGSVVFFSLYCFYCGFLKGIKNNKRILIS